MAEMTPQERKAFFETRAREQAKLPQFTFGDRVKMKSGFYKDHIGVVDGVGMLFEADKIDDLVIPEFAASYKVAVKGISGLTVREVQTQDMELAFDEEEPTINLWQRFINYFR